MIDKGTIHYKVMPFKLKSTRITYQMMVIESSDQFKKNMKAYVDDMLVNIMSFE